MFSDIILVLGMTSFIFGLLHFAIWIYSNIPKWRYKKYNSGGIVKNKFVKIGDCKNLEINGFTLPPGTLSFLENDESFLNSDKGKNTILKVLRENKEEVKKILMDTMAKRKPNKLKVDYEKLMDFLDKYPRELEVEIVTITEPPIKAYHDFTLGKPNDSLVAFTKMYDGTDYHFGRKPEHYIYDEYLFDHNKREMAEHNGGQKNKENQGRQGV